jgi:hypothetical protein
MLDLWELKTQLVEDEAQARCGSGKRMLVEAICQALRLEAAKAAAGLPERLECPWNRDHQGPNTAAFGNRGSKGTMAL